MARVASPYLSSQRWSLDCQGRWPRLRSCSRAGSNFQHLCSMEKRSVICGHSFRMSLTPDEVVLLLPLTIILFQGISRPTAHFLSSLWQPSCSSREILSEEPSLIVSTDEIDTHRTKKKHEKRKHEICLC